MSIVTDHIEAHGITCMRCRRGCAAAGQITDDALLCASCAVSPVQPSLFEEGA